MEMTFKCIEDIVGLCYKETISTHAVTDSLLIRRKFRGIAALRVSGPTVG